MSVMLRFVLIVASVFTMIIMMRKIRQSKIQIEDSLFWVGFSAMLILFSVFPGIVYQISWLVGTMAPSNFIFTFIIFLMVLKIFQQTIRISQLEHKMNQLIQARALEEQERKEKERRQKEQRQKECQENGKGTSGGSEGVYAQMAGQMGGTE